MNKKNILKIKNFTKINFIILFIILIICFINQYINEINYFNIKNIIITGNNFIDDEIINEIIDETLIERNILKADLKNLRIAINNNEFINSNKIYSYFPSALHIEIIEIVPLGIFERNNKFFLIDNKSNYIEANIEAINFFNVPIISSYNKDKPIDHTKTSLILKNILYNNSNLFSTINEFQYGNTKINIILNNKTKIKLNESNAINELNILFSFIKTIQNVQDLSSYKYIDLTVKNQIITKEKKINL